LRRAWAAVDRAAHVAQFNDMHDIGDLLVRAGLRDPVLDVDRLTISYRYADALFADLTATGARNSLAGRAKGLMGRRRWAAFTANLFRDGKPLELDLELVYGHAFGGAPMQARGPVAIDPAAIGRRR
jgi:malonyl-CoA O-methyltransferase